MNIYTSIHEAAIIYKIEKKGHICFNTFYNNFR